MLNMKNVGKVFSNVKVLDRVSFDLEGGEIVALLGANGAGKSTLMKILTGIYSADEGEIKLNGKTIRIRGVQDALNHGIQILPQEISLLSELSIAENIFAGKWKVKNKTFFRSVDFSFMLRKSDEILETLGVGHLNPNLKVKKLPSSEQRVVEIARCLLRESKVLILDEPTASLSKKETDFLFGVLDKLKKRGVGIIFISHYLNEVFAISDRIVVLRDGLNAGNYITKVTTKEEIVNSMLGQKITDLYPPKSQKINKEVFVKIESLYGSEGTPEIKELDIKKGEIFGIYGLIGSGIEEFGKALYGVNANSSRSEVFMDGKKLNLESATSCKKSGIGFVAAERKREGLFAELEVYKNATAPFLKDFTHYGILSRAKEVLFTQDWIKRFSIKSKGPDQTIKFLSGGNQQKICLIRWMNQKLKLLILEEPTRGVDVGAKKEIYFHLRKIAEEKSLTMIVISSDAEEITGLCDRAAVLVKGKIQKIFSEFSDLNEIMTASADF